MIEFLASIVEAFAAGALAKAGDVGGRAVADAYDALRALIVRKLGEGGAVQSVEDEPRSEPAQTALAEALTKAGLAADLELAQHAEALRRAVDEAAGTGGEALTCMRGAVEVYQQTKESYRLPIAQRRITEMEAELAELQR